MAEKIISPGVFTNEIDQSFLPSAVAVIVADAGPTAPPPSAIILTTVRVSECFKYSSAACDVKN